MPLIVRQFLEGNNWAFLILVLALFLTKRKTFLHLEERWSPVAGTGQQWTADSHLCNPTVSSSGRQRPLQDSGAAGTKEDNANNGIDYKKQQQSGCRGPEKLLLQYFLCFLFFFISFSVLRWDLNWIIDGLLCFTLLNDSYYSILEYNRKVCHIFFEHELWLFWLLM